MNPVPITLTQADTWDGKFAPQPYVVIGDVPSTGPDFEPQEAPEIDAEPADVDALAAQVIELRDALVAGGFLTEA